MLIEVDGKNVILYGQDGKGVYKATMTVAEALRVADELETAAQHILTECQADLHGKVYEPAITKSW
jgi:hypothetical protein